MKLYSPNSLIIGMGTLFYFFSFFFYFCRRYGCQLVDDQNYDSKVRIFCRRSAERGKQNEHVVFLKIEMVLLGQRFQIDTWGFLGVKIENFPWKVIM